MSTTNTTAQARGEAAALAKRPNTTDNQQQNNNTMSDTTTPPENVVPRRRASDWVKPATLAGHPDGSSTLSRKRVSVCLDATYELEALANILPGLVPNIAEAEGAHYAVRGIADRIRRLSHVLMAGLGDEVETVKNLERKVFIGAERMAT